MAILGHLMAKLRGSDYISGDQQDFLDECADMGATRCSNYRLYQEFYDGTRGAKLRDRAKKYLEASGVPFVENFCDVVVDTLAERLNVIGFASSAAATSEADGGEVTDDPFGQAAESWWQLNRMDAVQLVAHVQALVKGDEFVIVEWSDTLGRPRFLRQRQEQMKVIYSDDEPDTIDYAVKVWNTEKVSTQNPVGKKIRRLNLYFPGRLEKWYRLDKTAGGGGWIHWSDDTDEGWPVWWTTTGTEDGAPLGVPVVHIRHRPLGDGNGRSRVRQSIPFQEELNKYLADLNDLVDNHALPQDWVKGVSADNVSYKRVPGNIWQATGENAEFGRLDASPTSNLLETIEGVLSRLARRSRVPMHLLTGGTPPSGEALALDTPVQTPSGLRAIGELRFGDAVFGPDGRTEFVTEAFPVLRGRTTYRLRFDTGEEVIADASHKWLTSHRTSPHNRARVEAVVTTEEIARTLRMPTAKWGRNRDTEDVAHHRIPLAAPLEYPDADLPIDPYVFGAWLGDGDSNVPTLTLHNNDAEHFLGRFADAGERPELRDAPGRPGLARLTFGKMANDACWRGHPKTEGRGCVRCAADRYQHVRQGTTLTKVAPALSPSARARLSRLGALNNKHIPEVYFRASARQRLALLRGVMDTDGHATKDGRAAIDLHNQRLAEDLHRLVLSLGHKVALRRREYQNAYGAHVRWRMAWSPLHHVFSLPRKRERQRIDWGPRARNRYIVACEQVESVPVRCISVTGESHLFLIGCAGIATHNSLKTAESGLVATAKACQVEFGNAWEDAVMIGLRLGSVFGDVGDLPEDLVVTAQWANPETRSDKADLETASLKKTLGVSKHSLLAELGYDPEREAELRAAEAEEGQAAFAKMLAAPADAA